MLRRQQHDRQQEEAPGNGGEEEQERPQQQQQQQHDLLPRRQHPAKRARLGGDQEAASAAVAAPAFEEPPAAAAAAATAGTIAAAPSTLPCGAGGGANAAGPATFRIPGTELTGTTAAAASGDRHRGEDLAAAEAAAAAARQQEERREQHQQQHQLPIAPSIEAYMEAGGTLRYRPQPEWLLVASNQQRQQGGDYASAAPGAGDPELTTTTTTTGTRPTTFGKFRDPALHWCIRQGAIEAALDLIRLGCCTSSGGSSGFAFGDGRVAAKARCATAGTTVVDSVNAKGATPLMLAAHKGDVEVARALLLGGADPRAVAAPTGTTAALQAAHFGRTDVLEMILDAAPALAEVANHRQTTPLMRAAQEGHLSAVELLLSKGADPNRRNATQMTALMLSSQRGRADICRALLRRGADADAATHQRSTALLLACKRGHADAVKVLVGEGMCNLYARDARGRNARSFCCRPNPRPRQQQQQQQEEEELQQQPPQAAANRNINNDHDGRNKFKETATWIDPTVQVDLMRRNSRRERSYEFARIWNLLQQGRAAVAVDFDDDDNNSVLDVFAKRSHNDRPHPNRHPNTKEDVTIHDLQQALLLDNGSSDNRNCLAGATASMKVPQQALLRTMALPFPLAQIVARYLPLPDLWPCRLAILTRNAAADPEAAVIDALDFLDEVLEEGGFVEAIDEVNHHHHYQQQQQQEAGKEDSFLAIPPPRRPLPVAKEWKKEEKEEEAGNDGSFLSWLEWKAFVRTRGVIRAEPVDESVVTTTGLGPARRLNVTTATVPQPADPDSPTIVELRRSAGFLPCLAKSKALERRLLAPPYNMPIPLLRQLVVTSDLASLARRMAGSTSSLVHWEASVAMDLIMLASRLCGWYWRERE